MRKFSKDVWILIGLLVFVVLVAVFLGKGGDGDSGIERVPRATTYSSKPGGVKALYETLNKLDYPVSRKITGLSVDPPDGVLFILSPEISPSQSEWADVKRWVERGNILIVSAQSMVRYGAKDDEPKAKYANPAYPSFLAPGVCSQAILDAGRIYDKLMSLDDLAKFVKPSG